MFLKIKASKPMLEQSPENSTVLDGKDAIISCRAVGAPAPNITWMYNGKYDLCNFSFFIYFKLNKNNLVFIIITFNMFSKVLFLLIQKIIYFTNFTAISFHFIPL